MFSNRTAAHRLHSMSVDELTDVVDTLADMVSRHVDWDEVDDHDPIVQLVELGIVEDGRRRTHQFIVKITVEVEVDITTILDERDAREQVEAIAGDLATLATDAIERAPGPWDVEDDDDAEVDIQIGRTDHRTE